MYRQEKLEKELRERVRKEVDEPESGLAELKAERQRMLAARDAAGRTEDERPPEPFIAVAES
jgi:hypothetical protein